MILKEAVVHENKMRGRLWRFIKLYASQRYPCTIIMRMRYSRRRTTESKGSAILLGRSRRVAVFIVGVAGAVVGCCLAWRFGQTGCAAVSKGTKPPGHYLR